jgi:hypothetical protein
MGVEISSAVHVKFDVLDDGEPYCRGIVFALASVGRNPEGEDRADGLRAEHEHAVGEAETPKGAA